jgi:hypothetical protein
MNRLLQTLGICAVLALVGVLVFNAINDPTAGRHAWLAQRLDDARTVPASAGQAEVDLGNLEKAIGAKSSLWRELVTAAPTPASAPDLRKMLEGVTATHQEVGAKIKLVSKSNQRGEYVGQGDTFNGLIVKSVTPKEVLFSLIQNGQEYTLALPRQ